MPFDVQGAIKEGYTPAEIADHLAASNSSFDLAGARKEGYSDNEIISHLTNGAGTKTFEPPTDPIRAGYQATMNTVAKPINAAVSSVMSALTPPIPSVMKSAAQSDAKAIDSTNAGQWVGDKLLSAKNAVSDAGDNIKDLESYNPNLTKDLSAFGQNAQLLGNLGAVKPAESLIGSLGDNAAESLERPPGVFPKAQTPPTPEFDPLAYHQDINKNYIAAKTDASKMYNFTEKMAAGKPAENVPEIGKSLSTIIDDVESDPLHEGRSSLGKLKLLQDKIGQGDFDLSDAMDLKKTLNTYFNPKRLSQSTGDVPYLRLGKTLDTSLEKSAEIYPDFGMSKELSDKNWLNTVKKPFEDNPVLNKFWKPEDYYNHNGVENGMLDYLPDETAQRMGSMVKNIKNPAQLDAITRVASDEQADALRAAKLKDITQGQATSRLNAAGKAVGNLLSTPLHPIMGPGKALVNAGKVLTGPDFTAEQQALIKATKSASPRLSNYGEQFNELQSLAGQPKMTVLGQKSLSAPQETLALPDIANTTPRPMLRGKSTAPGAAPSIATDAEWQHIIDMDKQAQDMDISMDVRKAQQTARISEYERKHPSSTFFNKVGSEPIRPSQTALSPKTGDVRKLFPDEEGFKKGGSVHNKPLPAVLLAKARK